MIGLGFTEESLSSPALCLRRSAAQSCSAGWPTLPDLARPCACSPPSTPCWPPSVLPDPDKTTSLDCETRSNYVHLSKSRRVGLPSPAWPVAREERRLMPSPPPVASLREAYRARKTFLVGCDGIGFAGRDLRSGASPHRALFRRWRPLALIYSGLHSALRRSGASSGLAGVSLICEMGKGVKIRWCRAVPENRLPSSSGPAAPAGSLRGPSQPRRPPLCARRAAHRTPAALALSGGRLDST